MRRSLFISWLAAVVFSLSVIVSPMAATSAHTHHAAHGKAKPAAKSTHSSLAARKTAGRGRVKATGRFKTEPASGQASGSRDRRRVHPALRGAARRRGRTKTWPGQLEHVHLAMPAPLRGSHESLVHQNEMAEADGLERILDDDDLRDRIAHGSLVPVPVSNGLRINTDLPEDRRYCRPWTAKFLTDLARAHAGRFAASPIEVTSAVRTVEYQRQLRRINGNAAAADGDIASPHLTGGTVDIAKQGMSASEIGWLRAYLLPLEQQGRIDVEEEFRQSCFHISVYKSYVEPRPVMPANPASVAAATMLGAHRR
jgi:hypothetical protein